MYLYIFSNDGCENLNVITGIFFWFVRLVKSNISFVVRVSITGSNRLFYVTH